MTESDRLCLRQVFVLNESGEFEGPVDLGLGDGRIDAIERDLAGFEGTDTDEFAGCWVMPGIFDCHAHLACFVDDMLRYMQMPVTRWSLELAANARKLLEMGVTFVRDPGGADAGIRDGIAAGLTPGPTVQVSISALCQTGGHVDGYLPGPGLEIDAGFLGSDYPSRPPAIADGVEGVRLAVRQIMRAGADWLKMCTTGGLLSGGFDHPDEAEFSPEEVAVAVEEATRKRRPAMVHAYGGPGLSTAVRAGARSIEHGLWLTEEQAAEMAEKSCWLVPTLAVMYELAEGVDNGAFDDATAAKVRAIQPGIGQAVAIAKAAGVRIALGTDLITQHANPQEILLMHRAGLSVREALLSATKEGAELCGVGDRLGSLKPGYQADLMILDADPSDLTVFAADAPAAAVFQRGRQVYRRPTDVLVSA
jgi:imidazolonepropionase-like amidohydrolase